MLKQNKPQAGFSISHIATCDFTQLDCIDNNQLIANAGKSNDRIAKFIEKEMGISQRYHCPTEVDAESLAHSALKRLLDESPELRERAEFLIVASISNPRPVTTLSTVLAEEFGLNNASCWDLKSGCSSGVLALMQGANWLNLGARCGIIVAAENLSRFSPDNVLQVKAAAGDGAVAFSIEADSKWELKSVVHGTDARYANNIKLPGRFPINLETYNASDYYYQLDEKNNTLEKLQHYWLDSLKHLLQDAEVNPSDVNHYIAHQVDGSKNLALALASGIREEAVAKNFKNYGNMGSPTIFINYHEWIKNPSHSFAQGDYLVFHAVGGGISWASLCLQKVGE